LVLASALTLSAQIYGPPQVAVNAPSPLLKKIGIDQKMGSAIPLDVPFVDETGREVTLREFTGREFAGKPVILALVYFECPSLCNMVLNGVARATKELPLKAGDDYQVVAVSFDPRETTSLASAKREAYLKQAGATGGWHFLTGPEISSQKLADAVGFHYFYDSLTNQYAHSSAVVILTPAGRVSRYFYGINYPARDLRLALHESSGERISSPTDQILLYCYHYDPSTGKYALVVMNALRVGGLLTLGALATFMFLMLRKERVV
jgi:protein SCO1/2